MAASSWSDYERGKRAPRPRQLERLLQALGCDIATFEAEVLRVVSERTGAKTSVAGQLVAAGELLNDFDRELREVDNAIDRYQSRRRILLALRSYLADRPEGATY
jgi:transcriptional regulator with XRE-family HTH domain